jgi:PAS domain S-box-containing protein
MIKETNDAHFNRILVVDDTSANLLLLTDFLTEHGYIVHPASDGELALRFVRSILPDLILLDIRMPGMDGYEVCRRLKADERTRSIPIIFISVLEDECDKVKGFQAGGVDYITKPFQPEEILARVRTHLNLRELAENLEQKVIERTEELMIANQRLRQEIADRKRAEEVQQRESALLRCIIDSASDLIYIKDRDSVYLRCNKASEKFIGLSESEQIGKTDFDLFDGEKAEVIQKRDRQVLAEGNPLRIEEWVTDRDGGRMLFDTLKTPYYGPNGEVMGLVGISRDITERKRAEEERLAHLRLLEGMDRVNRAMQGTTNLEQMMSDVLDVALSIFDCDRAFLFYPCDPEASAWQVPMERNRPEYPGALALGLVMPMDEEVSEQLRILLNSDGPVKFGPGTGHLLPTEVSERFRFKSFMSMALYPRVGKPWQFGIHQCSYPRVWTPEEERLLQEIGRRLEDGLTSLLAHRDLRESEARYRRIVDTATEGIWVVGPDAMTTFVNARMAEMLGCSGKEMIGRPLTDFMFEEDAPDHLRKMENRRKGMSESYERRFRRQDGQTVWTHVSATPIFDAEHHFIGSFAMFTDITERKRMETELKESEGRYRYSSNLLASILESAVSVSVYALDREYRYLAFNRRHREGAKRLWGADITVGMSILDAIDTCEHREFCRQGFDKVLEGRSYFVESREVISGDGRQTVEYRDNYGSPIFNDEGDVVGLTVFAIDITERKRAEEEIRRLKNYLANIIDSMPSILVGMDRNETVTQWNRQAEQISGIPATEAVGRPITELLPDFSPWIKGMRSEIEQQRPASMEKLLIEKEGKRRFYDVMLYPLISNGVEGAVVRIEDATERARIQELMIQSEKMMSVGGLAAGMAHEINNPLGIITQAAQNIERRVSPELPANRKAAEELGVSLEGIKAYFEKRRIPEFIGSIREASLRASRIIANMLQFSRCAGTTIQPASLGVIIEQALELAGGDYDLKKKFDFRSIEIIRDYAPDMPEVPMVVVEMEQVMLNLLKNAAQAMILNPPDRRPRLTLRLRREERYALIEVEDNGPGMEEEVRRRVFEPFFTTKEPGLGTGLGLSVSYMIITQNHKGLMEAESKPGRGACFRVRLPLSKESIHE